MYGDSLDNKLLRFRTMTICRKYSLVRMETPSSKTDGEKENSFLKNGICIIPLQYLEENPLADIVVR